MHVHVIMHTVWWCLLRTEEGVGPSGTEVTSSCELHGVGSENKRQSSAKTANALLNHYLQPPRDSKFYVMCFLNFDF